MNGTTRQEETLILEYDLFSLPTAQHKAGLAGLLVMITTLVDRKMTPLPTIEDLTPTNARIAFTQDSLQAVFDDLYAAGWIEVESKQRWKEQEPKLVKEISAEVKGKTKIEKRFVYDAVQPKGEFLQALFPDGDGAWVKLWRDMLWRTLRGIPATRRVYEERAEGRRSSLGELFWILLQDSFRKRNKGKSRTDGFSSSLFVGAEDANAERVPFKGTVENNLLLHFWPIVSMIFVPRILSREKSNDQEWPMKRTESGFVLAIPEPSHLQFFCDDVREMLRSLEPDVEGLRPKAALIDLYEEGGLEFLYQFSKQKIQELDTINFSLGSVELYHLQKQGNRIRNLAAERIVPHSAVLRDYAGLRKYSRNPLFRSLYVRNLLHGRKWYEKSDDTLQKHPLPFFIYNRIETPRGISFFGNDVRFRFSLMEYGMKNKTEGGSMSEEDRDDQLALRVYRLVQNYVNYRTEEKSGKKFKDFRNRRDDKQRIIYPQEYREARERVCSDAFLAMRGRRDQDFTEYFAGTVCSVPHYMSEADYLAVSGALMNDWERIKILSMLALSAHSYLSPNESEEV